MKVIVTDSGVSPVEITSEDFVIRKIDSMHSCIGCYDCWVKTPGICIWKDDLKHFGEALGMAEEFILVSAMTFGSYSSFVQTVLERGLSYLTPTYTKRNGQSHHKKRYKNTLKLSAYFYGGNEEEKETAKRVMEEMALSLDAKLMNVIFLKDASEVGGGI